MNDYRYKYSILDEQGYRIGTGRGVITAELVEDAYRALYTRLERFGIVQVDNVWEAEIARA